MAARLTHIEGLKQGLHHLEHGSAERRSLARRLQDRSVFPYAGLGALGPDLYYFYHILSRRKNLRAQLWGELAHHRSVCELLLAFMDHIRAHRNDDDKRERLLAFTMGYISHCAVDIVTHPYIFYITGDYYSPDPKKAATAQDNHLRVEYILDSYLVFQRWGMDPREYDFLQYIAGTQQSDHDGASILDRDVWRMWVSALARVFPEEFREHYVGSDRGIEKGDILNESYTGMTRFARLTDVRSRTARALMTTVDWLTLRMTKARFLVLPPPHRVDPRLTNETHRLWRYPADPERESTESFVDLVNRAARFAAKMMSDAQDYIDGRSKRKDFEKEYSGYNLDTGLRSESVEMKAFQPIHEGD